MSSVVASGTQGRDRTRPECRQYRRSRVQARQAAAFARSAGWTERWRAFHCGMLPQRCRRRCHTRPSSETDQLSARTGTAQSVSPDPDQALQRDVPGCLLNTDLGLMPAVSPNPIRNVAGPGGTPFAPEPAQPSAPSDRMSSNPTPCRAVPVSVGCVPSVSMTTIFTSFDR